MNRLLFKLLTICLVGNSLAQGWIPSGARSASLANASTTLSDVWAFHHNPAATAGVQRLEMGIAYENRFLLRELQNQAFAVAVPLRKGVFSAGGQFHGFQLYRTQRIGIGYSLPLSEKLAAGVQMNYQGIRIDQYGRAGTVTGELGVLAQLAPQLKLGFSVFNPGRNMVVPGTNDRYATYMRLGLGYQLSTQVLTVIEAEKEIESSLRIKGGVEYKMHPAFFLRLGAAVNPVELSGGFGYQVKNQFKIDFGSVWHQKLGWSPHITCSFALTNSKTNE